MSVTLKSDNRILTANSKYSYLLDNYASGVSSITIVNTEGFSADDFILLEDFGREIAEIFRIGSINTTSGACTLLTAAGVSTITKFAHAESSKVYVIPYNQIRFYWTALAGDTITDESPTFATTTPLTGYIALEPAAWYTTTKDETHSTGFGWFVFFNSVTSIASSESNPIPYAGFAGNTVAQVFQDFDSLLNTNELKLVTISEKFSWLNEALAFLKNKLNLNNIEYFVSTEQTLSIISGTKEYLLPADFSDLVYITDGTDSKTMIPFQNVGQAGVHQSGVSGGYPYNPYSPYSDRVRHYLRNRYIGFEPTPSANATYKYRYRAKATTATSLSTYIDLPDNAFYALKDFMMYRACLKFNNPVASTYYEGFTNSVNHFIQASVKRDANLDTWGIVATANV